LSKEVLSLHVGNAWTRRRQHTIKMLPLWALLLGTACGGVPERQSCNVQNALGSVVRTAYARLLAVHCATGVNEQKTSHLYDLFEPLDAISTFCSDAVDAASAHSALYDIQKGLHRPSHSSTVTDLSLFDGSDEIKRERFAIGRKILETYGNSVCDDSQKVQTAVERIFTRARDGSDDAKRLFGFAKTANLEDHCQNIEMMMSSNSVIFTRKNENQPESADLPDADMDVLLEIIADSREKSEIFIFIDSPTLKDKSTAVGVASLAQTKVP